MGADAFDKALFSLRTAEALVAKEAESIVDSGDFSERGAFWLCKYVEMLREARQRYDAAVNALDSEKEAV
jgi:hypothetical protein